LRGFRRTLGKQDGPRYIYFMNAHVIPRDILRLHIAAVEEKFPLRFIGALPRGCVGHVDKADESALELLTEMRDSLTLMGLCSAEIELGRRLGRTVGLVLLSGLKGREAVEIPKLAKAI
jgi:hypothetical protein